MAREQLDFEWDEDKAQFNVRKHGITFEIAETVFRDPRAVTIYDAMHSTDEDRYLTFGISRIGPLVVVHTEREEKIRIISARKMTRRERTEYEQY